jgi:hypothetical protein
MALFSTFARDCLPVIREPLCCLLSYGVVFSDGTKLAGLGTDRSLSSSAEFKKATRCTYASRYAFIEFDVQVTVRRDKFL